MRIERSAQDGEVWQIIRTLYDATQRRNSENFLNGFPWATVFWHLATFEKEDFEELFLFWDGSAWGESSNIPPRRLKEGTRRFMSFVGDISKPNFEHFVDILRWRDHFRSGREMPGKLIIVGEGERLKGRFMILDGNHRAVAALWWVYEANRRNHLPMDAWLGLSPQMSCYPPFSLILRG